MTGRPIVLVLALFSAMLSGRGVAAQECSRNKIEQAAAQVLTARDALFGLQNDDLSTDVSAAGQQLIASMKMRLGEFVNAYMRCTSPRIAAATVQRELSDLVHIPVLRQGYRDGDVPREDHGVRLAFDVRTPPGGAQVIGISATFQIQCGMDTVLFLFVPQADAWRETLRWQAKDYNTVAGAFWSFEYGISPPDRAGKWYVVAKSISPWCSSTWSGIRYSALRPRPDAVEPVELLHGSEAIWWGGDDFGKLTIRRNDFELRFRGEGGRLDRITRLIRRRFSIVGDTVRQIGAGTAAPLPRP